MSWLNSLRKELSIERSVPLRFAEPLSAHTSFCLGGPADVWAQPENYAQLRRIIRYCLNKGIPYLIIGRGSNILFADSGFRGVVICLDSPGFGQIKLKGNRVAVGAGACLSKLIGQMQKSGLGGLEFLTGIPASVGGAIAMNAGSREKSIGSFIQRLTVMNRSGAIKALERKQLNFAYRQANLDNRIVLQAWLKLIKKTPLVIKKDINSALARKRKTQDLSASSAGCIFKNPQHRLSAAQMIEACGLKRSRKGGAEISAKHANYILNRHGARAKDVLYLIRLAQRQVKRKFGVQLKPEIKIIK